MDYEMTGTHSAIRGGLGDGYDRISRAIAEIDAVGQVVRIGSVVHEEIGLAVVKRARRGHQVSQLMNGDFVHEGEIGFSQRINVLECGGVITKEPLQSRGEIP